jgi:hypothetical protein
MAQPRRVTELQGVRDAGAAEPQHAETMLSGAANNVPCRRIGTRHSKARPVITRVAMVLSSAVDAGG